MSVLFTIYACAGAECIMNEKFSILHEAPQVECRIENFEFIICKQNTNLTVSNTI